MPGHHREFELAVEVERRCRRGDPFDVSASRRYRQYRRVGVDPAKPPVVAGLARVVEELARAAADVDDRCGLLDQGQLEVVARPPRVEDVVERCRLGVRISPRLHHQRRQIR